MNKDVETNPLAGHIFARPLGASEAVFAWVQSTFGALTVASVSRIVGDLNANELGNAFRDVSLADPCLSGTLLRTTSSHPILQWDEPNTPTVETVSRPSDSYWQDALQASVNQPFDTTVDENGEVACKPLCSLKILQGINEHEMVIRVHHGVCDGRKLSLLVERVLSLYQQRMSGNRGEPNQMPVGESLESRYSARSRVHATVRLMQENIQAACKSFGKPLAFATSRENESTRSQIICWSLDPDQTKRLVARCRQEGTTVNAALAAAEMAVYANMIRWRGNISLQTTIDCPSRTVAEASRKSVGTYSFSQSTWHRPLRDEFWVLAKRYRQSVLKHNATNTVPPFGFYSLARSFLLTNTRGGRFANVADLCLSNLGRLNIRTDYGGIHLRELYFASSQCRLGGNVVINAATAQNQLSLTCVTPSHVPADFGREMQVKMRDLLLAV